MALSNPRLHLPETARAIDSVGARQIPALTGLRFVAAFAVAFGHTIPTGVTIAGLQIHGLTAIAMPLFFTLSGFIIHYTYGHLFAAGWRNAAREFTVARLSRIYPLYAFLLLVTLALSPMAGQLGSHAGGLFVALAYALGATTWLPLQIDGKLLAEWHYGISWSIATEFFFYICYAAVLYQLVGIVRLRVAVAAWCGVFLVACLAVYAVFATKDAWEPIIIAAYPALPRRLDDFQNSFYRWALYYSPYGQLPCFVCGVLICQIHNLMLRARVAERFPAGLAASLAVIGIAVTWMAFQWVGANGQWLRGSNLADYFVTLHLNVLFVPFSCLLILALAAGRSTVGAILSLPAVVFLGEVSYAMYLSHPIAQYVGAAVVRRIPWLPLVPTQCLAILVASVVLYRWVEMPSKRLLRRAWTRRRAVRGAPPTLRRGSAGDP